MRTAQVRLNDNRRPHSHAGLYFVMARNFASMSFRPRRDVGSMRGARSSILGFMKWIVLQVRRAAITVVRHHVHHFNSDVLTNSTRNAKRLLLAKVLFARKRKNAFY